MSEKLALIGRAPCCGSIRAVDLDNKPESRVIFLNHGLLVEFIPEEKAKDEAKKSVRFSNVDVAREYAENMNEMREINAQLLQMIESLLNANMKLHYDISQLEYKIKGMGI